MSPLVVREEALRFYHLAADIAHNKTQLIIRRVLSIQVHILSVEFPRVPAVPDILPRIFNMCNVRVL